MFIPEGVNGYNPKYKSSVGYNPVLANKLLDYYGYKKGADGYHLTKWQAFSFKN